MIQKIYAELSSTGRIIFIVAVLTVVVLVLDLVLIRPSLNKLASIQQSIVRQEQKIGQDMRFLSYKDKIVKDSKAFEQYFEELRDDDVINAEFLSNVERLATQAKVSLIKSNPTQSKKHGDYVEYYANLDCSGSLKDVVSFMYAVNSSDDLLKIVQFNMTPKKGSTADEVSVSMTILKLVTNLAMVQEQEASL